jgi:hypothetical protein
MHYVSLGSTVNPGDDSNMTLQNTGKYLPSNTAEYPKRLELSATLLGKPEILIHMIPATHFV